MCVQLSRAAVTSPTAVDRAARAIPVIGCSASAASGQVDHGNRTPSPVMPVTRSPSCSMVTRKWWKSSSRSPATRPSDPTRRMRRRYPVGGLMRRMTLYARRPVRTGRLEAFSDGVMAIAITLLVLDLRVPARDQLRGESLLHALGRGWPNYFAYAITFAVIGIMGVNHHALLDRCE